MSHIFLSYRRTDAPDVVGRIFDKTAAHFGSRAVFRDIDSIPLGIPFAEVLRDALAHTRAVLVVIGPHWLTSVDAHNRRRIDDPNDFVRLEIEIALELDVPTIPVIVGQAIIPTRDALPDTIADLAERQGIQVRPDPDFHQDMTRLLKELEKAGVRRVSDTAGESAGSKGGRISKINMFWYHNLTKEVAEAAEVVRKLEGIRTLLENSKPGDAFYELAYTQLTNWISYTTLRDDKTKLLQLIERVREEELATQPAVGAASRLMTILQIHIDQRTAKWEEFKRGLDKL